MEANWTQGEGLTLLWRLLDLMARQRNCTRLRRLFGLRADPLAACRMVSERDGSPSSCSPTAIHYLPSDGPCWSLRACLGSNADAPTHSVETILRLAHVDHDLPRGGGRT
jgi:hypothetical protein